MVHAVAPIICYMFNGLNYLISLSNLCCFQLILFINVFLSMLVLIYTLSSKKLLNNVEILGISIIFKALLNKLLNIAIFITCLMLKLFIFVQCSSMYGHLVFTRVAYSMLYLSIALFILVQKSIIFELTKKNNSALEYFIVNNWFLIIFSILWLSGTLYCMIFTLDCAGVLVLLLVLTGTKTSSATGILTKLNSISVNIWVGFLSTTILLLSGVYAILVYGSTQTSTLIVVATFLTDSCIFKLGYTQQLSSALVILAVFTKTGLSLFFVWKRMFFKSMDVAGLIIYLVHYFTNIFIYTIFYILSTVVIKNILYFIFSLLVIGSLLFCIFVNTKSVEIYSFFAISTLFNTTLILCAVLVDVEFINILGYYRLHTHKNMNI